MLRRLLHRLVARPWIYDLVQRAAGSRRILARLARQVAALPAGADPVLDVGGGTGLARPLWPAGADYLCLDLDPEKLAGLRRNHRGTRALQGDGTAMGLKDETFDVVLLACVLHHIPPDRTVALFAEIRRVLRPWGRLLLVEPLWVPRHLPGRLLWRYDRGSHPRTSQAILANLTRSLAIIHREEFTTIHRFLLCVAAKEEEP